MGTNTNSTRKIQRMQEKDEEENIAKNKRMMRGKAGMKRTGKVLTG